MKNYVNNKEDYDFLIIDQEAIKDAYDKQKKKLKHPTSVNLPEEVVVELKDMAQKKGIPYQTLMRMFIIEGLKNYKKAS